jgi:hypothetical protein
MADMLGVLISTHVPGKENANARPKSRLSRHARVGASASWADKMSFSQVSFFAFLHHWESPLGSVGWLGSGRCLVKSMQSSRCEGRTLALIDIIKRLTTILLLGEKSRYKFTTNPTRTSPKNTRVAMQSCSSVSLLFLDHTLRLIGRHAALHANP